MISPRRAPVRPRVISSETGETVLLEDVVGSCTEQGHHGAIEIRGGPRTGKTVALAHLASLANADRLLLVDDARPADIQFGLSDRLVVYTTRCPLDITDQRYELAPWCDDDLIEYLRCQRADRCLSVMARFAADGSKELLDGKPELYCTIAEQMAASESVHDIRTALRQGIAALAGDEQTLQEARFYAAAILLGEQQLVEGRSPQMSRRGVSGELFDLLSYSSVQVLLTADRLISVLKEDSAHPFPKHEMPRRLVSETARICAECYPRA